MDFPINHVLFPTDFSKNAQRALPFAAEIADRNNAKLTLFHASQETMDMAPSFEQSKEKTIKETTGQFEELITELRQESRFKDLEISTILQSGQPVTSLLGQIEEDEPDLIVMGTKGATGDRNVLMGSVTTNVVKKSKTPALAIPDGCSFDNFKNITFATDYKEGDWSALEQTTDFAKLFDSAVDVLHIAEKQNLDTELRFRGFRELVKSRMDYKNIDFHIKYESDFFPGAADYLIENPTSLLVIVRYKKSFWERMAERNHSKEMALYSKVPLLVLPGEQNKEKTTIVEELAKERS